MGQMKNWGMELLDELTERYVRMGNLEAAATDLIESYWATGQFTDKAWLRDQINAVRDHPEMFGHTNTYWRDLAKGRRDAAERRSRIRTGRKGAE